MTGMKACPEEARHIFVAMQIVVPDELPSTEMMQLVRDVHFPAAIVAVHVRGEHCLA